jgi:hypothetical protein
VSVDAIAQRLSPTIRLSHLVGTIPAETTGEAMALAEQLLGPTLQWLPDGETGERRNWIATIIDGLGSHPDLELVKAADWSSYDDTPRYRIRKRHRLRGETMDFGHVGWFRHAQPEFRIVKERLGRPDLALQIGVPGPVDMAAFTLGPRGALLHRKPFQDATVAEIAAIFAEAGQEVVFQVEVPFELVLVAQAPAPLRPLVARWFGSLIASVAREAPAGARFGIHLCLGDLDHKSLTEMKDIGPVVHLANAIAAAWPAERSLDFVHAPFAGASQPPPSDPNFYAPLWRLRLPGRTRFIAGFVFEHQSLEEQRAVLAMIERAYGRRVDVSAACGMGRRSMEETVASLKLARQLAAT